MTALLLFVSGVTIGVVFDKMILSGKEKILRAAKAATDSFNQG